MYEPEILLFTKKLLPGDDGVTQMLVPCMLDAVELPSLLSFDSSI